MKQGKMLRLLGAVAALTALGVTALGGVATGSSSKRAATVITMEGDGQDLRFVAPESVEQGTRLKVENLTRPNRVGPHTFSLIKKSARPTTGRQERKCGNGELKVCNEIAGAHEFDPQTGQVGKPVVEVGERGWDRSASRRRPGDSWYTEEKNESDSRKVSARAGKKLHFICVIHPFMQDKIKVEG